MKTVKCLIIDDEPIAAQVIQNYLEKLETFEIVKICNSALIAFEYLQENSVDLVFLDIQMPKISGLEFLKALQDPPKVIIVTAYREYAYEGFELDVVDYLLKPVSFERFLKAINKYNSSIYDTLQSRNDSDTVPKGVDEFIWVRADRKNVKIAVKDIKYIEGLKDYVKIYVLDNMIISKIPLKKMEQKLPSKGFIRIHRSYLISISKITAFNNDGIEIERKMLPIGKNYKGSVLSFLEKHI
jgi:DNA-binding LytR/AlgR family response regulator